MRVFPPFSQLRKQLTHSFRPTAPLDVDDSRASHSTILYSLAAASLPRRRDGHNIRRNGALRRRIPRLGIEENAATIVGLDVVICGIARDDARRMDKENRRMFDLMIDVRVPRAMIDEGPCRRESSSSPRRGGANDTAAFVLVRLDHK
jgi:hypothetical protein